MSALSSGRGLGLVAGLVLLKLWLVSAQPIVAIGGAFYDDALFIDLAKNVAQGDWLGPYQQATLMKGPAYPLWIAGLHRLGIPVPPAQHVLYLCACLLVLRALRPLRLSWGVELGLFCLLWWNPMSYDLSVLGRVLRQHLYTPASLLAVAGGMALVARSGEEGVGVGKLAGWGLLGGGGFAVVWLTREESIWIVPTLVLFAGYALGSSRSGGAVSRRAVLLALLVGGAGSGALIGTICGVNARHYGWFGTVELRATEFVAAYGALQRIDAGKALPFTPVNRAARERAYAVSPTFARLRERLEGPDALIWSAVSEPYTGRPRAEKEIAGGWFIWFFRESVVEVFRPKDAATVLAVYARIAAEINAACDDGRLEAGPRHDSLAPRLRPGDLGRLLHALPEYLDYFVTFRGFSALPGRSSGTEDLLEPFRRLTGWPLASSPEAPASTPPAGRWVEFRLGLLQALGKGLRWICAAVALGGLAAWVGLVLHAARQRRLGPGLIIATGVLGAWTAVVLVNAAVHVLSFPNRSVGALAQAYPLLLVFAGVALHEGCSIAFTKRPGGRAQGP